MRKTVIFQSRGYRAVSHANGLGVELFDDNAKKSCYLEGQEARNFLNDVEYCSPALVRIAILSYDYRMEPNWPVSA